VTFRARSGRLVIAAIATGAALGLLAPPAASAEPPQAVTAVHQDAVPPLHPGYELAEVPGLSEVRAEHYRALLRNAEIRRDVIQAPARRREARTGRTVFVIYQTD
jgi:hypothetical protein